MRSMKRVLATAVATAAMAAGAVAFAAPAAASPEDGEGCVGFPAIPAAYVCVISVTPTGVVPTTTTTNLPVTIPEFCYAIDCLGPTTVNVPVPGLQPGSGVIATIWYNGVYYPVAIGTIPGIPGIPSIEGGPGLTPNPWVLLDTDRLVDAILTQDTNDLLWIPIEVFMTHEQWFAWFNCALNPLNCV